MNWKNKYETRAIKDAKVDDLISFWASPGERLYVVLTKIVTIDGRVGYYGNYRGTIEEAKRDIGANGLLYETHFEDFTDFKIEIEGYNK